MYLIGLERALDLNNVAGRQQSEHQQYAGLLRREILAGDDAALTQPSARRDTTRRPAALHDNDAGFGGALEGGALLGRWAPRGKAGRDEAACTGRNRGVDQ